VGHNLVGYVRASANDQRADLQHDAMTPAGRARVLTDTTSGAPNRRSQFDALLDYVRSGDVLVGWRKDWLGRSVWDLTETVHGRERAAHSRLSEGSMVRLGSSFSATVIPIY
jgi:DNA invertase Pin-like site-specific DNA recombinase